MGRTRRRVISSLLTCSLVLGLAGPAGAALTDQQRAERAVGYIASQQKPNGSFPAFSAVGSTADAVLAFVAAGVGQDELLDSLGYLRRQMKRGAVTTEGLRAKVALAFASAGRDARTIGGVTVIKKLRAGWADGPASSHAVYDTALVVLAFVAAGATPPAAAVSYLIDEQCPDGGWAYDRFRRGENRHCKSSPSDFFASDTNTTALVLMALDAHEPATPVAGAFQFFAKMRDGAHGGWGYTWGLQTTDANSTSLVLQAYAAEGLSTPNDSPTSLPALQYGRCGAFAYTWDGDAKTDPDLGATIGAVPGLLGEPFPFTGTVDEPAPDVPACRG